MKNYEEHNIIFSFLQKRIKTGINILIAHFYIRGKLFIILSIFNTVIYTLKRPRLRKKCYKYNIHYYVKYDKISDIKCNKKEVVTRQSRYELRLCSNV